MTEDAVGVRSRLGRDLAKAAEIGRDPRGGISRFAWTPELAQATDWVAAELTDLGLVVATDEAGNMIARWAGSGEGTPVMAASHLDTVANGGAFDGVLGVLAAVEAVRALRDEGFEPLRPIWIGAFMDEEGTRFGTGLFGSRAFCGVDMSASLELTDAAGVSIAEAMRRAGKDPAAIGAANRVHELGAYVELHVEQGPVLENAGLRLGVVESISGIRGCRVRFEGETNHAGTTPVELRRDALVGAARVVLALREAAQREPRLRATVGKIRTIPGGSNVVPGVCEMTVDLRPSVAEVFEGSDVWLAELVARVAAEEGLTATVSEDYTAAPIVMDPGVVAVIDEAVEAEGVEALHMVSGAGHDAMLVAPHVPTGMLFVPSRGGLSHTPGEFTEPADCDLGARVLAGVLRRLASAARIGAS